MPRSADCHPGSYHLRRRIHCSTATASGARQRRRGGGQGRHHQAHAVLSLQEQGRARGRLSRRRAIIPISRCSGAGLPRPRAAPRARCKAFSWQPRPRGAPSQMEGLRFPAHRGRTRQHARPSRDEDRRRAQEEGRGVVARDACEPRASRGAATLARQIVLLLDGSFASCCCTATRPTWRRRARPRMRWSGGAAGAGEGSAEAVGEAAGLSCSGAVQRATLLRRAGTHLLPQDGPDQQRITSCCAASGERTSRAPLKSPRIRSISATSWRSDTTAAHRARDWSVGVTMSGTMIVMAPAAWAAVTP